MVLMSASSSEAGPARAFSQGYIKGVYGRFFELSQQGNSAPCPIVINHFEQGSPSASGHTWTVPHDKIVQNGVLCDGDGDLVLYAYDQKSQSPAPLKENDIAQQTFEIMKNESTGFWMGIDSRTCGKWIFPNPSFIFFIREFERELKSFFNLQLAPGKKYMFVAAPTFTCIYSEIPKPGGGLVPPATPSGGTDTEVNSEATSSPMQEKPISNGSAATSNLVPPGAQGSDTDANSAIGEQNEVSTTGDGPTPSMLPDENEENVQAITNPASPQDISIVDIANGSDAPSPDTGLGTGNESIADINGSSAGNSGEDAEIAISSPAEDGGDDGLIDGTGEADGESLFDLESNSGESLCFPASAKVELLNGSVVEMRSLTIGEEVKVAPEKFSRIFMFTHSSEDGTYLFVRIGTRCGKNLRLTPGHLLYINGALKRASEARVGDFLFSGNAGRAQITSVSYVHAEGVFNPQTLHGDIVVDGIVASTYTASVEPETAHGLLVPLRALWKVIQLNVLGCLLDAHAISKERVSLRRLSSAPGLRAGL